MPVPDLPLIAYRGLWDKFAAPGSRGALTRAFLRGVPSLAWLDKDGLDPDEVLVMASDPAINRRGAPVLLVASALPVAVSVRTIGPPVCLIVSETRDDRPWPIFRLDRAAWTPCGYYLPVAAACSSLAGCDLAVPPGGTVFFESENVIDDVVPHPRLASADDTRTCETLSGLVPSDVLLARVSDLVELDQLELVTREAA